MGNVIRFDGRGTNHGGAEALCAEFLSFAHGEARCANASEAELRAVARYGYRASGGVRWLQVEPDKLLLSCLPEEWSRETLARAEGLALTFLTFLAASKRMKPADAAFLEGWVRSARAMFLDILLEEAELAARASGLRRAPRARGR